MATDLYIREVDSLRFEISINRCNDKLRVLAHDILLEGLAHADFFKLKWDLFYGLLHVLWHLLSILDHGEA